MNAMTAGITKAGTGIDGISWNILGQTYVPKQVSEGSFSWHATFPPGTFVPPHIHPAQDEFIYMLEGRFDLVLDGKGIRRHSRRSDPAADADPARHFQQVRPDGEMLFLGGADAQALRPVLGHSQHERTSASGGRYAGGQI